MKKIRKQLENILIELEGTLEQRNIESDGHSEKWQESKEGEIFEYKSGYLRRTIEDLEMAIHSLDTFIE